MKMFIVLAAFVAVAVAGVPQRNVRVIHEKPEHVVTVVKETPHNNIGLDGYKFSYELSDGQVRQETSQVESRGLEDAVNRVHGSFSWVDAEGKVYTVKYVADENGFHAEGDHLPVAPQA